MIILKAPRKAWRLLYSLHNSLPYTAHKESLRGVDRLHLAGRPTRAITQLLLTLQKQIPQ